MKGLLSYVDSPIPSTVEVKEDPIDHLNAVLDDEAEKVQTGVFFKVVLEPIVTDDRYAISLAQTTQLNPRVVIEHEARKEQEA